jgi:hypothetical protein
MNYCGSGSGSGPVPVPDPDLFSTVFQQRKNLAFSMLEAALFPRKMALLFLIV